MSKKFLMDILENCKHIQVIFDTKDKYQNSIVQECLAKGTCRCEKDQGECVYFPQRIYKIIQEV